MFARERPQSIQLNSKKPFENTEELIKYSDNGQKSVYLGKKGKIEDHKKKEPKPQ